MTLFYGFFKKNIKKSLLIDFSLYNLHINVLSMDFSNEEIFTNDFFKNCNDFDECLSLDSFINSNKYNNNIIISSNKKIPYRNDDTIKDEGKTFKSEIINIDEGISNENLINDKQKKNKSIKRLNINENKYLGRKKTRDKFYSDEKISINPNNLKNKFNCFIDNLLSDKLEITKDSIFEINDINYLKDRFYYDENFEKKDIKEINQIINNVEEPNRVYIQSDTEGKVYNIVSTLQLANIIQDKQKTFYYNFFEGTFVENLCENIPHIKVNLFEVNKEFKGTYIHLGDIVDRCFGNNQCLKSLLQILYVKQELYDNIKLVCGNHEISVYSSLSNINCACKDFKSLTSFIVFNAIRKGHIKFFDQIKIGEIDYMLTHKVIYNKDITNLKNFVNEFSWDDNLNEILFGDENEKSEEDKVLEENKDLNDKLVEFKKKIGKENDIFKIKDTINDLFKTYFERYCNILFFNKFKDDYQVNLFDNMFDYSRKFDVLNNTIMDGTRVSILGYKECLENQICGHDHHESKECYKNDRNILFVDNFSECTFDNKEKSPLANLHFFDKTKEITYRNIIKITNKKSPTLEVGNQD